MKTKSKARERSIAKVSTNHKKLIDITPTPRILRTLGEIPFQPWQCIAELVDNALDAFAEISRSGTAIDDKKINVCWSSDGVASKARSIEISDTGVGIGVEQIQNAARAGYSSNDPTSNLGLFGMGFNIATARLGETTRLYSTKKGDKEWVGIEIDFPSLIKNKNFSAPIVAEKKTDANIHGTKIVVSNLREGPYIQLRDQEALIRRQLEVIYSSLLDQLDVDIIVQGKKLMPRRHCVWGSSRYVTRDNNKIPAIIQIDRGLGTALFNKDKNTYLSQDEESVLKEAVSRGQRLPSHIIERRKRLTGWIGIQRYSDPNDFGIDFIRNGRKILIGNKSLFSYDSPMTGTSTLEYPVELGSTVGGRIVGEVHVDYLLPTYQKNDFDRTDPSWAQTVEALRGVGPMLPKLRKAVGYDEPNGGPVALLANAYRRTDPGVKNLFVERQIAKEFAERFRRGDQEFISDDKWWQAAQDADRLRATSGAEVSAEVDPGNRPTDNPDDYAPSGDSTGVKKPVPVTATEKPLETSTLDELITSSRQMVSWSGPYSYGNTPALQVKVWELNNGKIMNKGALVPCLFFMDGVECDFVYDPRHPFLEHFHLSPRELLSVYLAEKFKARDHLRDVVAVFTEIMSSKLTDLRIDRIGLQEKASGMFDILREKMIAMLSGKAAEVLGCVHESSGETEETVNSLLSNNKLLLLFQNKQPAGIEALQYVPYRTLLRVVDKFPGELFDGKVFAAPYNNLNLNDTNATERSRTESKDRILSFLKDALWVITQTTTKGSGRRFKDELARCAHSIRFLSEEISN